MNISFLIRDLLLRNEQLVIPGFGTFRIVMRPARISRSTQELLPPVREIVFDSHHRMGDNQLLLAIRKKGGIAEAEAMEMLKTFVRQLESGLREGTAVLEGLGKLESDKKGGYTFRPVDDLVNFTGIFALPKLELETTLPPRKETAMPSVAATRPAPRRRWWLAVLVVVLAAAGTTAYLSGWFTTFQTAEEPVTLAEEDTGRIVFGERPGYDSITEVISRKLEEETSRVALRPQEPDTQVAVKPDPVKPAAPVPDREIPAAAGPYHIITGAFSVPENAGKQHADLKARGFNPTLLPKRGKFYMVSLGAYASHSEASKALEGFKQKIDVELWIKKIQ